MKDGTRERGTRPPNRVSRKRVNAALLLQSPFPAKENQLTDKAATETRPTAGAKFGTVAPERGDLPLFIRPGDLSKYDVFTIYAARKRYNARFKYDESVFDVAIQVPVDDEYPTGVRRATVTLKDNEERAAIRELVARHRFLTNCRLDRLGGYWKLVDAETPRPEPGKDGDEIEDTEIPF